MRHAASEIGLPFWVLLTIKLMEMSEADKHSRLPYGPNQRWLAQADRSTEHGANKNSRHQPFG
jgi:hypothetical protein